MKTTLLSIKTKYVEQIAAGSKHYEYRRCIPDFSDAQISQTIIVYSSAEDKAIIGQFTVDKIISTDIDSLITETNIPLDQEPFFREYFKGKDICHAIKIKNFRKYGTPLSLKELKKIDSKFTAPQNYRFLLKESLLYTIIKKK